MVSTRTGPNFRILNDIIDTDIRLGYLGIEWVNYGQDILFAKKLGCAFWALVLIELHGANATIKGWTKGL